MNVYVFINYHLDIAIFVALTLLSFWVSRIVVRRKQVAAKMPLPYFVILAAIVVAGITFARYSDQNERAQIRQLVSGLAPTFAYELESIGHATLTLETPPDDPTYLAIIEREKAWLKFNPNVADIYTYRRLPDGKIVFIADSETDYNHDGKYEGDREQRTDIGEPYKTATENTRKALAGEAVFDTEIVVDEWGSWVSFDQPIFDREGKVEAVVGVDFPAEDWLKAILTARVTSLAIAYILILTIISSSSLNILMKAEIEAHERTELALMAAKEASDAANQAKSNFLATMSHEIRTPMNGIIGFSSLLLDTPLDADQRDYVVTLSKSADSLLVLINDILDLSKIEAGRIILEDIPYSLDEAIDNLKLLLAPSVQSKGLHFVVDIRPPGLVLMGDPLRVRQVLLNLLANAIKFTPAGEVALDVSWSPSNANKGEGRLRCAVRDTGIGISADKLPQLFQRFSQLDASTTRRYGGTGLGLVISEELTSLMGGSIQVSSTPGQGSVFTVDIPAKLPSSAE
ncbi:MAG: Aerobic respiration control sensor protein ArcB [Verrucomicrobiota bacterium]